VSHDTSTVPKGHPAYGTNPEDAWKVQGDLPFTFTKTKDMKNVNFTMHEDEV